MAQNEEIGTDPDCKSCKYGPYSKCLICYLCLQAHFGDKEEEELIKNLKDNESINSTIKNLK